MNYELVTGICLAVGIGCLLLAGVLFFALEVPMLVREMRGRRKPGRKEAAGALEAPEDVFAESGETVKLDGEETMRMAEENMLSGAEKTVRRS